jgi:arginyl-tRNA synthetase
VTTEYYFNDAGAQIDRFASSLLAIARHEDPPDDGYAGEYLSEIASTQVRQHPGVLEWPRRQALEIFRSGGDRYDPALLTHDRENDLLKALAAFPAVVAAAAELRQPHRVARYLEDVSGTYHRFYDACRVLPRDDGPLDETGRARLWLAAATRIVLANGLGLLGVTAPDRL